MVVWIMETGGRRDFLRFPCSAAWATGHPLARPARSAASASATLRFGMKGAEREVLIVTSENPMRNPIGIVLAILGIILLVSGIVASDSISSSFSKFFTGAPSDKSVWMMIGGALLTAVGAGLSISGGTKSS